MAEALEINDLKKLAQKRVPRMFFDYVDSGSWREDTYRDNEHDFTKIKLCQRVGLDIAGRSTKSEMIGQSVAMPVAVAPVGLLGMQRANGEILAAKACEEFGVPFTLSTMSICSIEDVATATKTPFWFQLYMTRDKDFNEALIGRAETAGCSALVVTLDLQVMGHRLKDSRNGMTTTMNWSRSFWQQILAKPRWCMGMASTSHRTFGNIVGHAKDVGDTSSLFDWVAEQFDQGLTWEDIRWIRKTWPGKLILKGIMDSEDARIAADLGADALIVSNHGGRQLDGAPSSIAALPNIVAAVGSKIELHMDGGIRSGQDVLKALSMGAKGVYIGRAAAYGVGAAGQSGVRRALEIIQEELDLTMALCGETSVQNLGPHNLVASG